MTVSFILLCDACVYHLRFIFVKQLAVKLLLHLERQEFFLFRVLVIPKIVRRLGDVNCNKYRKNLLICFHTKPFIKPNTSQKYITFFIFCGKQLIVHNTL